MNGGPGVPVTRSRFGILGWALVAAACAIGGTADDGPVGQPSAEVPFEPVLHAYHSGLTRPVREVVHDEEAWTRLWEQIHARVTPRPPRPAVDFSSRMLIAVATGTRPTGGFDVAIRTVTVRGDALEVEVFESCPLPDGAVAAALTDPVVVVVLESLPQAPEFRETTAPSCR
jgi:hypothetical protein